MATAALRFKPPSFSWSCSESPSNLCENLGPAPVDESCQEDEGTDCGLVEEYWTSPSSRGILVKRKTITLPTLCVLSMAINVHLRERVGLSSHPMIEQIGGNYPGNLVQLCPEFNVRELKSLPSCANCRRAKPDETFAHPSVPV